jgi:hypothetical protein
MNGGVCHENAPPASGQGSRSADASDGGSSEGPAVEIVRLGTPLELSVVGGVDGEDFKALGLEKIEERIAVGAGGFQGDGGDAAGA